MPLCQFCFALMMLTSCLAVCLIFYTGNAPENRHQDFLISSDSAPMGRYSSIKDEHQLYQIIHSACDYLVTMGVGTRAFVNEVIAEGSIDIIDVQSDLVLFRLNEDMARNPSLIASALIDVLRQWYLIQKRHKDDLYGNQLRIFEEIWNVLYHIEEGPLNVLFERLYYLLQRIFGRNRSTYEYDLNSKYKFIFEWSYYHPLIEFISNGTLTITETISERSQTVIFKVQSDDDRVFALKMYKYPRDWKVCRREESILILIAQRNAKYASLRQDFRMKVPVIFPTLNGVSINCFQHNAFLMSFVDGMNLRERAFIHSDRVNIRNNTLDSSLSLKAGVNAITIYSHLMPTIMELSNLQIFHSDITERHIIFDQRHDQFVLIDFSSAYFLPDLRKSHYHPIIGSWSYYAESLQQLNEHMIADSNENVSSEQIAQWALNSDLYSLQTAILHTILRVDEVSFGFYQRIVGESCDEIERIWRTEHPQRLKLIRRPLRTIWKMREAVLRKYIEKHPDRKHLLNSVFAKLIIT